MLLHAQKELAVLLAVKNTTTRNHYTSSDLILKHLASTSPSLFNFHNISNDKLIVYNVILAIKSFEDSSIEDTAFTSIFKINTDLLDSHISTISERLCEALDFEFLNDFSRDDLLKGNLSAVSYNQLDSIELTHTMLVHLAIYFFDNIHFSL